MRWLEREESKSVGVTADGDEKSGTAGGIPVGLPPAMRTAFFA